VTTERWPEWMSEAEWKKQLAEEAEEEFALLMKNLRRRAHAQIHGQRSVLRYSDYLDAYVGLEAEQQTVYPVACPSDLIVFDDIEITSPQRPAKQVQHAPLVTGDLSFIFGPVGAPKPHQRFLGAGALWDLPPLLVYRPADHVSFRAYNDWAQKVAVKTNFTTPWAPTPMGFPTELKPRTIPSTKAAVSVEPSPLLMEVEIGYPVDPSVPVKEAFKRTRRKGGGEVATVKDEEEAELEECKFCGEEAGTCLCEECPTCGEEVDDCTCCEICERSGSSCSCVYCVSCLKKFDTMVEGCEEHQTCGGCDCSLLLGPGRVSTMREEPPWVERGLSLHLVPDTREYDEVWGFDSKHYDPVTACAEFYLLSLLESCAGPHRDAVQRHGYVSHLVSEARLVRRELISTWDSVLRRYVALAAWGEIRHHMAMKRYDGGASLGRSLRPTAWVLGKQVEEQVGAVQAYRDLSDMFLEFGERSGYGGERWAQPCRILADRLEGLINPEIFVDRCFTLEHNGGCFFNKLPWKDRPTWRNVGLQAIQMFIGPAHSAVEADFATLALHSGRTVNALWSEYLNVSNAVRRDWGGPTLRSGPDVIRDWEVRNGYTSPRSRFDFPDAARREEQRRALLV